MYLNFKSMIYLTTYLIQVRSLKLEESKVRSKVEAELQVSVLPGLPYVPHVCLPTGGLWEDQPVPDGVDEPHLLHLQSS